MVKREGIFQAFKNGLSSGAAYDTEGAWLPALKMQSLILSSVNQNMFFTADWLIDVNFGVTSYLLFTSDSEGGVPRFFSDDKRAGWGVLSQI